VSSEPAQSREIATFSRARSTRFPLACRNNSWHFFSDFSAGFLPESVLNKFIIGFVYPVLAFNQKKRTSGDVNLTGGSGAEIRTFERGRKSET